MIKQFFNYIIPSVLAFALSGVYAIVDGFFVGNSIGDSGLAAINIAYPITAFLQSLGTGIGMGGAILLSISKGAEDQNAQKRYFSVSAVLLIAFGIATTIFLLLTYKNILTAFGAHGELLSLSSKYTFYISLGALFQILGTGIIPFIRNISHASKAMVAMIAGFITNIILDYILVWNLDLGMEGAAVATIIGQAVTLLVSIVYLLPKRELFSLYQIKNMTKNTVKHIILLALSPFGLTFSPNITLILVNKSLTVYGNENSVACFAAISYISCVVFLLLQGVGDGSQPLISMYMGQGNLYAVKKNRRLVFITSFLISVVCAAALYILRDKTAMLFGASPKVINEVSNVLPIIITGYVFVSVLRSATSFLYAVGKSFKASLLIYGEPLLLFVLLMILPHMLSVEGVWFSIPISQIIAAVAAILILAKTNIVSFSKS